MYRNPCHAPCSLAMLNCWRLPSVGHDKGTWVDVSSCRLQPDSSIVSLACWVDNANHPNILPIETVSAGGNRPFGTNVQTIEDGSNGPVSQQWDVPCIGGVSYHSVTGRVTLGFSEGSSSGKHLVLSSRLPGVSSTQKHTTKW